MIPNEKNTLEPNTSSIISDIPNVHFYIVLYMAISRLTRQ